MKKMSKAMMSFFVAVLLVTQLQASPPIDSKPDYYSILGVEFGATVSEIERAYHQKIREARLSEDSGSAVRDLSKVKHVRQAYLVLSNASERQKYDEARERQHRSETIWRICHDLAETKNQERMMHALDELISRAEEIVPGVGQSGKEVISSVGQAITKMTEIANLDRVLLLTTVVQRGQKSGILSRLAWSDSWDRAQWEHALVLPTVRRLAQLGLTREQILRKFNESGYSIQYFKNGFERALSPHPERDTIAGIIDEAKLAATRAGKSASSQRAAANKLVRVFPKIVEDFESARVEDIHYLVRHLAAPRWTSVEVRMQTIALAFRSPLLTPENFLDLLGSIKHSLISEDAKESKQPRLYLVPQEAEEHRPPEDPKAEYDRIVQEHTRDFISKKPTPAQRERFKELTGVQIPAGVMGTIEKFARACEWVMGLQKKDTE